jgi:hypothetical protein
MYKSAPIEHLLVRASLVDMGSTTTFFSSKNGAARSSE